MNIKQSAHEEFQKTTSSLANLSEHDQNKALKEKLLKALARGSELGLQLAEREAELAELNEMLAETRTQVEAAQESIEFVEKKCWELEELCDSLLDTISSASSRQLANEILHAHAELAGGVE